MKGLTPDNYSIFPAGLYLGILYLKKYGIFIFFPLSVTCTNCNYFSIMKDIIIMEEVSIISAFMKIVMRIQDGEWTL